MGRREEGEREDGGRVLRRMGGECERCEGECVCGS